MSEPNDAHVITEIKDRVLTIRLNRPDKKNALSQAMYTAMTEALKQAAADDEIRVVLFVGTRDAFTSGNDLQDFLKQPTRFNDSAVGRFIDALGHFPKAAVAAINGPAVGIGVTLLLHCDLVYAGENTRLQLPFVNIGICAEFASSLLLPKIMGHARAAELLLLGEPFTAAQAREYGIVNAVLPDAEVDAHAFERARRLAQQPPNALRVTKMLMKRWDSAQVDEAIQLEASHFLPMLRQPEAIEAMTAFMSKRKPDFSAFK
jgi:enoyl-CoA hydratase/carnithine racemase